jgi:exonuclease I
VKIKTGSPGSNPLAPVLQRDAGVYELALADVYVPAGAATILESNITDLRGNPSMCGTVSSIVSEAHVHEAATQTKAGFMSANDKKNLDTVNSRVNQDVSNTASPTFKTVTAEKVIGAVYA